MLTRFLSKRYSVIWVLAIALIIVPFAVKNRYYQDITVLTFLWAGLATSWNLYSGYCKRLSIGHAAFIGIGAYTSTLLFMKFGISPWLGMLAGVVLSVMFALMIGGTTLRLKGTFFVLSTIAFAEVLKVTFITAEHVTGGPLGILIPYEPSFGNMVWSSKLPYAVLIWLYMLIVLFISVKLERSKFGYYLIALGENQEAAESLGVDATKTMLMAFVLSAAFTSIGGTLFAQYIMFIEPESLMSVANSVNFILISIIGGLGTAFGPFVGALIITPLSNLLRGYLSSVSGLHGFIFGLILVIIILYKPDGVFPQLRRLANRILKKSTNSNKGV
ncbi:MAG: branched-chain amino acid ABC transporter permease [Clostridia bacterium]